MSLLNFNTWHSLNEAVTFDKGANYPDKTFGYPVGTVDTVKVFPGGSNGDWGGSMQRALWFARTADDWAMANGKNRSLISSQKRSRVLTASGNTSDHYKGNNNAYAVDIAIAGMEGDALLAYIMEKFGHPEYKGGSWFNITIDGYRYQVGWKVKNHFDHIHVGVKKTIGERIESTVSNIKETLGAKLIKHPKIAEWLKKNIPNAVTADQLDGLLKSDPKTFEWFKKTFNLNDAGDSVSASVMTGSIESNWMDVTKKVIDNFEGGYWNYWECKDHPYSDMFKNSGETMFGLDRKAGAIETIKPEGEEFFRLIDAEKKKLGAEFCKKWKWNYRGGELEEPLKDLASKIMFKSYERNMKNYVKDPETKKRIESNRGLLLHMSYACWNGPAFFRDFAKLLDTAVKEGKTDADLLKIAKDSRTARLSGAWAKATVKVNSLIDQESGLA